MRVLAFLWALAAPAAAQDVVIIGEVHDNPAHHAFLLEMTQAVLPRAIVIEMLDAAQAGLVENGAGLGADALAEALGWGQSGWPDFGYYYPILTAVDGVRIYGAHLGREAARGVMRDGPGRMFSDDEMARLGLDEPLSADEQAARETLQFLAHCEALPRDLLPQMVTIQRVRDGALARAVLAAVQETGGPVVVITGNGHARRDWGVPALLARAAPGLELYVIGQTEAAAPLEGGFDRVVSAPAVDRPDPCDAFR